MSITGAILIGGLGQRFGGEKPKQFINLAGHPLYFYSLNCFLRSGIFDEILLVCPESFLSHVRREIDQTPVRVIAGGRTRQESSYLACQAAKTSFISIHDGARPFVTPSILETHKEMLTHYQAIGTCIPATDSLLTSSNGKVVDETCDRSLYYHVQTPQTFNRGLILEAHEKANKEGFVATEDCALMRRLGFEAAIAEGTGANFKITTPLDFLLAKAILEENPHQLPHIPKQLHS